MKRFLAFAGKTWRDVPGPGGGAHDLVGDFSTMEEALDGLRGKLYEWAHILDQRAGSIIRLRIAYEWLEEEKEE